MLALKILVFVLIVIGVSAIETFIDKKIGIDLSHFSAPKRIVHDLVVKLGGVAIVAAAIWLTQP